MNQCMDKLTPTGVAPSVINSTKVDIRIIKIKDCGTSVMAILIMFT